MKVTMIGRSGSGKTTFMSGMYALLGGVNHIDGFRIREDTKEPNNIDLGDIVEAIGKLYQISFERLDFSFPNTTASSTTWPFQLIYYDKEVCNFEWIDYRGGILEDILELDQTKRKDIDELLNHIKSSDSVILAVDSLQITLNTTIRTRQRHTGANIISQILMEYAKRKDSYKPLNILIAITKSDSDVITEDWIENNYQKLCDAAVELFDGVIEICKRRPDVWQIAVVAVGSVGKNNLETTLSERKDTLRERVSAKVTIKGDPEPINIDKVLFYCLGQAQAQETKQLERSSKSIETQINVQEQDINLVKAQILELERLLNNRKKRKEDLLKSVHEYQRFSEQSMFGLKSLESDLLSSSKLIENLRNEKALLNNAFLQIINAKSEYKSDGIIEKLLATIANQPSPSSQQNASIETKQSNKLEMIKSKIKSLDSDIKEQNEEIRNIKGLISEYQQKLQKEKQNIIDTNRVIEDINNSISDIQNTIESCRGITPQRNIKIKQLTNELEDKNKKILDIKNAVEKMHQHSLQSVRIIGNNSLQS